MSGVAAVSRLLRARRLALTCTVSVRRGRGAADTGSRVPCLAAKRGGGPATRSGAGRRRRGEGHFPVAARGLSGSPARLRGFSPSRGRALEDLAAQGHAAGRARGGRTAVGP